MKTSIAVFGIFGVLGMFLFVTNKQQMATRAAHLEFTKPERIAREIDASFTTNGTTANPVYSDDYGFLEMQQQHLKALPKDYFDGYEAMINGLYLQNNDFTSIPSNIRKIKGLIGLNMANNQIEKVPEGFFTFANNLRNLDFSYNKIEGQFKLMSFVSLDKLNLEGNNVTNLFVGRGQSIKDINLTANNLNGFPINLSRVHHLTYLSLAENDILSIRRLYDAKKEFIAKEYMFEELIKLDLENNNLEALPRSLDRAPYVEELMLEGNNISGTVELKGYNHVSDFKLTSQNVEEFIVTGGNKLRTIDLKNNQVNKVEIGNRLIFLEKLLLQTNALKRVPEGLKNAPALTTLALSNNSISSFSDLKNCYQIQTIDFSHNQLREVPYVSYKTTGQLTFLDVSHNKITKLDLNKIDQTLTTLVLDDNDIRKVYKTNRDLHLVELDLSNNPKLRDISLRTLSSMPKLKILNIGFTGIRGDKLERIRKYCNKNDIDLVTFGDQD